MGTLKGKQSTAVARSALDVLTVTVQMGIKVMAVLEGVVLQFVDVEDYKV